MASPPSAYGEQTTLADRKRRAGQRLVLGFAGASAPAELRALCREAPPAGFILFARNVEEPAQVRELCRELRSLLPDGYPPLLTVDQEGGRVQRIPGTTWPPAAWLGNADDPALTRTVGEAMGAELAACGLDLTWAPVADLAEGDVLGDRCFGRDPGAVGRQVAALAEGLHRQGVIAAAKHFPGLGAAPADPHGALPAIEKEPPGLEAEDLAPFRAAIQAGVGAIMAAHAIYPAWDEDLPASLSRRVLKAILREKMKFEGVIVTDDLGMGALGAWAIEQRLDLACRATADLLLLCHEDPWEPFETLVRLQEDHRAHDDLAIDSSKRVMELRRRFFLERPPRPPLSIVGAPAHHDLALQVRFRGQG